MPRVDLKLKQLFIDLSIDEDYLSVSECSFFILIPLCCRPVISIYQYGHR